MSRYWKMTIFSSVDDKPFWINCTGFPAVRCPACNNVWGIMQRLPQLISPEISRKLKAIKGSISLEKFTTLRSYIINNTELTVDIDLFEPGVWFGTTKVIKCHTSAPSRCYVYVNRLFISDILAKDLRPFNGDGLFLMTCDHPYEWLIEIIPIPYPRHQLFSNVICRQCGRRDYTNPDKLFFNNLLKEKENMECMLNFPGIEIVTDGVKRILESMALPNISFEPISFAAIWEHMGSHLRKQAHLAK